MNTKSLSIILAAAAALASASCGHRKAEATVDATSSTITALNADKTSDDPADYMSYGGGIGYEYDFPAMVNRNESKDTTVVVGGQKFDMEKVNCYFFKDSAVYMSVQVCALQGSSPVNARLAQIVDEGYCDVTGGTLAREKATTPAQLTKALDDYGKSFIDTVIPQLGDALGFGFQIMICLEPVYATPQLLTYAVYNDSYSGGAHSDYEFYYATIDRATGRVLSFEDLVPAAERAEVRQLLIEQMGKAHDLSPKAYLKWLSEWADPSEAQELSVSDFPIYHTALTDRGLAFAYPKYSIGPGCEGCPVYFISWPLGDQKK